MSIQRIISMIMIGIVSATLLHIPNSAEANIPATSIAIMSVANQNGAQQDTCVSDLQSQSQSNDDGLLTQVIDYIKEVIDEVTQELYEGVINHPAFQSAINAAFILFVTFFGVAFIFGIVPLTFGQALTRLLKIAVISALILEGFAFFNEYVIQFFNDGTDELIDSVIGIASGDSSGVSRNENGAPQPFKKLEGVVGDALSPEMMISAITAFTTGPMGPAMGGLMGIAMVSFIQMIVKALRVYCIALVAKALLFGLAPIFIAFILFERTKHIFSGWVNQLVNYSLQPLMLFAFLSFFVVLIGSAVENILGADICWTSFDHLRGETTQSMFWRYVDENGDPSTSDFTWDGLVSCIQQGGGGCPDFPVNILDILAFLLLAHLGYRFSDVVVNIATEIASSTLFLDKLRSGLGDLMRQQGSVTPNSPQRPGQR